MKERTGIFINPNIGKDRRQTAVRLSEVIPDCSVYELNNSSLKELGKQPLEKLIVVGGDGSVRMVTERLLENESLSPLIVLPGGTQNSFYKALVDSNAIISLNELRENVVFQSQLFKPGMANQHLFNVSAGFGEFERYISMFNEWLRSKPVAKKMRLQVAGLITVAALLFEKQKNQPFLQLAFTCPYIGPFRAFPEQNLSSKIVGLATIDGRNTVEMAGKLFLTLLFWQFGSAPPTSILHVEYGDSFFIKDYRLDCRTLTLDGDMITIASSGEINVKRHEKVVQLVALVQR